MLYAQYCFNILIYITDTSLVFLPIMSVPLDSLHFCLSNDSPCLPTLLHLFLVPLPLCFSPFPVMGKNKSEIAVNGMMRKKQDKWTMALFNFITYYLCNIPPPRTYLSYNQKFIAFEHRSISLTSAPGNHHSMLIVYDFSFLRFRV